jgi:hypothetical protein
LATFASTSFASDRHTWQRPPLSHLT